MSQISEPRLKDPNVPVEFNVPDLPESSRTSDDVVSGPLRKKQKISQVQEIEGFDYSTFTTKDALVYYSQLPLPFRPLLKLKVPQPLTNGAFRNYCACTRCGFDQDGETFCGTDPVLSESDQYEIVQKFWECFLSEDLIGFIKWAQDKTGREIVINKGDLNRVNLNYISIMLFFTLTHCCTAVIWLDFINFIARQNENCLLNNKVGYNPKYIFSPLCMTDDHILHSHTLEGTSVVRQCVRLIKKNQRGSNVLMLNKLYLLLSEYPDQQKLVFNKSIRDHKNKVVSLVSRLGLLSTGALTWNEKNYVVKVHNCNVKNEKEKILSSVIMCDFCNKDKMVFPLKDYSENFFLQ